MRTVEFLRSDDLLHRAWEVFLCERTRLADIAPDGDLELTGASSNRGLLTTGDIDLHLRVVDTRFAEVVTAVGRSWPVVHPEIWAHARDIRRRGRSAGRHCRDAHRFEARSAHVLPGSACEPTRRPSRHATRLRLPMPAATWIDTLRPSRHSSTPWSTDIIDRNEQVFYCCPVSYVDRDIFQTRIDCSCGAPIRIAEYREHMVRRHCNVEGCSERALRTVSFGFRDPQFRIIGAPMGICRRHEHSVGKGRMHVVIDPPRG